MEALQEFSFIIIRALQSLSPGLDGLMKFFSFLGSVEFYLLLVPLIYWTMNSSLGMRLLLVLVSTDFLGMAFKQLFHQPRPYWLGEVKGLATETSYGIPSTHSSDSLAVWGYLAFQLKRNWLSILGGSLVFFIALSRLYLGVHFLHDVLFGWLIGGIVIYTFLKSEARVGAWWQAQGLGVQILLGFAISAAMILVGLLVLVSIAGSPDPEQWASFSREARSPTYYFTLAGAFFGAVTGYALMRRFARFQTAGSVGQRVGRYLLGMAGVLAFYLGLDLAFAMLAADETLLGYLLRYIRYGTATLWLTFLAPWIFLKLKLAKPG